MEDNIFAQNIRAERARLGMTQEQLAAETGLNPNTIMKYERGKTLPLIDKVPALAKALHTTPNALCGW